VGGIGTSDIERTAKNLKRFLACGGTCRDGLIELQGEHKEAVKKALVGMGYKEQNIDLS
jgi:translation initiation factor 1